MDKKIKLSVVIPAYNEEESIKSGALDKVYEFMKSRDFGWEVLVVDDGSNDRTVEFAQRFAKNNKGYKVLNEPHRGKGGTVIAGMMAAKGEIVLFTDMDQATPIKHVDDFLPEFEKGADVVIGRRTGRKGAPIFRKIMAFGFVVVRTVILRLPFADTQCGFKAFTRKAGREVFSQMESFANRTNVKGASVQAGFDVEMLFIARKKGFKIVDVPVSWDFGERRQVSAIKDSLDALRDIARIRINSLMGKYK